MNSGLTSHQQRGHTETGPRFKASFERPEKRGIDLAIKSRVNEPSWFEPLKFYCIVHTSGTSLLQVS